MFSEDGKKEVLEEATGHLDKPDHTRCFTRPDGCQWIIF